eukprot:445972-Rhodomonas_salina.1
MARQLRHQVQTALQSDAKHLLFLVKAVMIRSCFCNGIQSLVPGCVPAPLITRLNYPRAGSVGSSGARTSRQSDPHQTPSTCLFQPHSRTSPRHQDSDLSSRPCRDHHQC